MHLQSEHIAVVSMLLHLRAVHLIMRELTEGLDVLNGHHLLCPEWTSSVVSHAVNLLLAVRRHLNLSEGISF